MKEKINKLVKTPVFQCILIAVVLDIVLEILGRHSFGETVKYIFQNPLIFLYNCSIIFFTMTLALLLRKRVFGYCFISFAWLLCGVTNFIVLGFRMTPFSAIDMLMAGNTLTIIDKYFSMKQIVIILVCVVLALAGLVILFIKSPTIDGRVHRVRTTIFIIASFCSVMLFTRIALNAQAISDNFANLATAYDQYGFAYCFSNSVVDVGISKPDGYSEEYILEVKDVLDEVGPSASSYGETQPNVIIVQLESFMDPSHVKGLELNENPIPNFTALREEFSSGFLSMPAIGAGTANSEFEVLSGFDVAYFGAGEYPYKTVLGDQTCETLASLLKKDGYSTHAIHNHDATFYDRYQVYANLGFDTFTPMEYMYNVEVTQKNWEKDNILTSEIMENLESTEGKDFVFTVSVQGHGRYPSELDEENYSYPIVAKGAGSEDLDTQWTYYCNQLYEMDQFIGDLIQQLKSYDEDCILVMYGDHLPGFELSEDDLDNANLYQTEYFIWSNMDNFVVDDKDMYAYEMSTRILDILGYDKGVMQKFQTAYDKDKDKDYSQVMRSLEYDMLYGQRYMFPDGWPYERTDMTYGIKPIKINNVITKTYEGEKGYIIRGTNFNEFTFLYVDGDYYEDTTFINENELFVPKKALNGQDGKNITTAQVGDDSILIGISPFDFTFHKPSDY